MGKTKPHEEEVKSLGRSKQTHGDPESLWELPQYRDHKGPLSAPATAKGFLSSAAERDPTDVG